MFTIDLKGQTAILTGAGQGLAKSTAEVLADCGCNICAVDIVLEKAEQTAKEIEEKYGVKAIGVKADVTNEAEFENAFKEAKEKLGSTDILVNVAGACFYKDYGSMTAEEVEKTFRVNVFGLDNGGRIAMKYMAEQGGGKIINIASVAGRGRNNFPHYAASKAAVINLTKNQADYGAKKGIRVNCVCPGIIRTDFWERFLKGAFPGKEDGAFERICGTLIPLGVPQEAVDIGNAICFLVSDKARYITGQALNVCGGMSMD